jgi:hypothetical protein
MGFPPMDTFSIIYNSILDACFQGFLQILQAEGNCKHLFHGLQLRKKHGKLSQNDHRFDGERGFL